MGLLLNRHHLSRNTLIFIFAFKITYKLNVQMYFLKEMVYRRIAIAFQTLLFLPVTSFVREIALLLVMQWDARGRIRGIVRGWQIVWGDCFRFCVSIPYSQHSESPVEEGISNETSFRKV